jgi:hypothetical protein
MNGKTYRMRHGQRYANMDWLRFCREQERRETIRENIFGVLLIVLAFVLALI